MYVGKLFLGSRLTISVTDTRQIVVSVGSAG